MLSRAAASRSQASVLFGVTIRCHARLRESERWEKEVEIAYPRAVRSRHPLFGYCRCRILTRRTVSPRARWRIHDGERKAHLVPNGRTRLTASACTRWAWRITHVPVAAFFLSEQRIQSDLLRSLWTRTVGCSR